MSQPTLDPNRFVAAVLADPSHKLPLPDRGGRYFLEAGETIDSFDPFYAHLLADGSLRPKPPTSAAVQPEPAPSDASGSSADAKPALDMPSGPPPVEPTEAH